MTNENDELAWPRWQNGAPDWLNDMLWTEVPGRFNRTFRLDVRKEWSAHEKAPGGDNVIAVRCITPLQSEVLARINLRISQPW